MVKLDKIDKIFFISVSNLTDSVQDELGYMEKVIVTYDSIGNTLDIWFGEPCRAICQEIGRGIIIKKNKDGKILGFEKLNYIPSDELSKKVITSLPVEIVVA